MERMLKLWWVGMKKLKDSWNFNYPGFSINWAGDIRRRCEWKKHKWSARMLVLYRPRWEGRRVQYLCTGHCHLWSRLPSTMRATFLPLLLFIGSLISQSLKNLLLKFHLSIRRGSGSEFRGPQYLANFDQRGRWSHLHLRTRILCRQLQLQRPDPRQQDLVLQRL